MSEEAVEIATAAQRRTLWIVLMLNAGLALAFVSTGLVAQSTALIANGIDNASDAIVYVISLLALTRPPAWKRGAARVSGVLLLIFATGILLEAVRGFVSGSEPVGLTMMLMALGAAVVNWICLRLLQRLRKADVATRAATTFSANDFISNAGVLVAGGAVLWTGAAWPDLVVGVAIAAIAIKGSVEIFRDANAEAKAGRERSIADGK